MNRLENDAKTDMDVRREYARELTRRGDARGRLLELSFEPDERDPWLEVHKTVKGNDALIEWLSGYLMHWTELNLSHTQVSDLSPLKSLTNLEWLRLSYTEVSDLTPLKGLSNLQLLDLDETQVMDLTPLRELSSLETLNLDETQVMDLTPLKGLTSLQSLWLDYTQIIDLNPLTTPACKYTTSCEGSILNVGG